MWAGRIGAAAVGPASLARVVGGGRTSSVLGSCMIHPDLLAALRDTQEEHTSKACVVVVVVVLMLW